MTGSNVEDVEENLIKLQHKNIFQDVWKDPNKWDDLIFNNIQAILLKNKKFENVIKS